MPEISTPAILIRWVAHSSGVLHYGEITPDQVVTTGLATLDSAENENEYLGLMASYVDALPEMPLQGTELQAGDIYSFSETVYMVRQSHARTEHDPADVPALFFMHRVDTDDIEWIAGEWVHVGAERSYLDLTYKVVQAHQTQLGWEPPNVPALWVLQEPIDPPTSDWQIGATYIAGDTVLYQGVEYVCIQGHTTIQGWEPPHAPALWGVV